VNAEAARAILQQDLARIFSDVKQLNSARQQAERIADAVHRYAVSCEAFELVKFSGFTGPGNGGIDQRPPGPGMSATVSLLESDLCQVFNHGDALGTHEEFARRFSVAVNAHYLRAWTKTMASKSSSSYRTTIGGLDKRGGAIGLTTAKPAFVAALTQVYSGVQSLVTISEVARRIAVAISEFLCSGRVIFIGSVSGSVGVSTRSQIS